MEPKLKRPRLTCITSENITIHSILSDEYSTDIPLTKVYIAQIENTKNISLIMREIAKCLPLESLQHLKRVRKKDIIVCTKHYLRNFIQHQWNEATLELLHKLSANNDKDDKNVIAQYTSAEIDTMVEKETASKTTLAFLISSLLTSQGVCVDIIEELCDTVKLEKVPSRPPKLRWQYENMNAVWPCKFHPDKYMESLCTNTNFTKEEREFHIFILSVINALSKNENDKDFGICVDPRTNSLVAIAPGMVDRNPICHCPMVLIDFVARTQNGGVWTFEQEDIKFAKDEGNLSFQGLPEKHLNFLRHNFGDIKFGAQKLDSNCKTVNLECIDQDNLNKYGPYLCTGYNVYLSREPCLMCAMALIHSRVRRVFYRTLNPKGALGSNIKLHTVKELNHRFEVFYCLTNDSTNKE